MELNYRLLEFNIFDKSNKSKKTYIPGEESRDEKVFMIQMFGINETGKTCSIFVEGYEPFFYVSVPFNWEESNMNEFIGHISEKLGSYYDGTLSATLIKQKKLYGFDGGKLHNFICIKFKNESIMKKTANIWYEIKIGRNTYSKLLIPNGYDYNGEYIQLYESNIPPLLRMFHIKEITPSGWIQLPTSKIKTITKKSTKCDFEYLINYNNIISLPNMEVRVPYKIASFDIEANSSHGDFPLPEKDYKKMATNIIELYEKSDYECDEGWIENLILTSFGYGDMDDVDTVYPKKHPNENELLNMIDKLLRLKPNNLNKDNNIEYISQSSEDEEEDDLDKQDDGVASTEKNIEEENKFGIFWKKNKIEHIYNNKNASFIDMINDEKCERDTKMFILKKCLNSVLPPLKGDEVTFIGTTFIKYGDEKPYRNNCLAVGSCDQIDNADIQSFNSERELLLAWTELINEENPDIIIGYNIFGFDYEFMFKRAKEVNCLDDFLKLSRNKDEICCNPNDFKNKNERKLDGNTIILASGQYDLKFIKMSGRLQIDLYNYFRRDYNLTSYKLDYVSGYFIGDVIKKIEHNNSNDNNITIIYSKNLTGLDVGSYINFEEISHSSELYKDGKKFEVINVNHTEYSFTIKGIETPDMTKMVKWGMAKDDITHQDIFKLTKEGPRERSIIAKYCIQDCNLLHHLMRKIDVITGYIEMANLCSVPISYLVMRGQGIKLFSFIAKKCRDSNTLIPVIEKKNDGGYEGAIVLPPKCGLYLDEPIACVDYGSLYPSSMISENLSHDSKVWTIEYDLAGRVINETGEKDENGNYIYDNLKEYKYVDITYDTYEYIRPKETAAAIKIKVGSKKCRFAQFPNGEYAIMPKILKELLVARKNTRTQAEYITIKTRDSLYTGLPVKINNDDSNEISIIKIKDKDGIIHKINKSDIIESDDTYDDFMKNVLEKRQLAIKVTANSLYGQCGAKTSSFYEKDVAASTTATGRKLLTYGKRIIEEVYGNKICETKYGKVHTHAEYIYGDTDSIFMSFKLTNPETGEKIIGKEALKHTIELAQEAGALATRFLKEPHDLEYEKTFLPFCLLSKKRYVGMLYEFNPDKCYRKSMGIVLKRRDNAPIVKDIYGGIIDILMKDKNINKAREFLDDYLNKLVNKQIPIEKLIITKSLRSGYKNPLQIAHKVLADRMGKRDSGNKPGPGDRIPFAYILTKNAKLLQGDKIEHPNFIRENNLKLNYSFYITNQIMKPIQQLFSLVLYEFAEFRRKKDNFEDKLLCLRESMDYDKYKKKETDIKNKEVKIILFDKFLRVVDNEKMGNRAITSYFSKIKT
jgi:DNA polymerase elongation subunit (family B)